MTLVRSELLKIRTTSTWWIFGLISLALWALTGQWGMTNWRGSVMLSDLEGAPQVKVVPIVRDVVEVDDTYAKGSVLVLSPNKTKIGYINIPKFYRDFNDRASRNVTDDTRKEIQRLKKENVEKKNQEKHVKV